MAKWEFRWYGWLMLGSFLVISAYALIDAGFGIPSNTLSSSGNPGTAQEKYIVLGWNNLGMHCYNEDFKDLAVLPPYNTLWAQVIRAGNPPKVVTTGITVEYGFPDNTYSVDRLGRPDKSNFWKYAQQIFNLSEPLPPNVGLAGKGLSGKMDAEGDHFIAEGIPLTQYRDQDAVNRHPYPFQKAVITVRDSGNYSTMLASITVVAPVSTEMSCINCHGDDGDATTRYPINATGKVETNILVLHDYLNNGTYPSGKEGVLMDRRPVLCAECHSSNALNAPGASNISSLSNAMHRHHKDLPDITPDTNGCYNCHPGPKTRCLRDTMSQNFALNCTDCHGKMEKVSQNPEPWLNEPQCSNQNCHGAGYQTDQNLYRMSRGHGGVFCAGCHDSPHAIAPSREPNDAIKFVELQGHPGTLRECTVCHATKPEQAFKHAR